MKAIVCRSYGVPSELQLTKVTLTQPKSNEVLVRVCATAINDWDWSLVRGKPLAYRLIYGLFKPKKSIFGVELAGIVEQVGAEVTKFSMGDKVYGDISLAGMGAWAEFASVTEDALVAIPDGMSFEEAAALPHASILAWQGLVDRGQLQNGENLLINGAGGGVGTCGVQIASAMGARVTGVDHEKKLSMMKDLGFEHVIDYQKEDFTRNGQKYDLILDAKTTRWPLAYLRSLKPGGKYVTVGGSPVRLLLMALFKPFLKIFSRKELHILALKPNEGLDRIGEHFQEGKIKPIIDGPYPLEEIPQLLQYFGEGKHQGKIVITI